MKMYLETALRTKRDILSKAQAEVDLLESILAFLVSMSEKE